jgi:hypothetical protein
MRLQIFQFNLKNLQQKLRFFKLRLTKIHNFQNKFHIPKLQSLLTK